MKKIIFISLVIFLSFITTVYADYLVPKKDFIIDNIPTWLLKKGSYYKIVETLNTSYKIRYNDKMDDIWVNDTGDGTFIIMGDSEPDVKNYVRKEQEKEKEQKAKKQSIVEEKYKKRQEECKDSLNWIYSKNFDKMRNKEAFFAETISLNEFDLGFPYNKVFLKILIRKGATLYPSNAVNLILSEGQFHRSEIISIKFDNFPIEQYSTSEASSGTSTVLFINNHIKFVERLISSKKVIIEVSFFQRGRRQFEFNTECLVWRWD